MEGTALHGGFPFAAHACNVGSPSHACSKVYLSWYGGARVSATGASLSLTVAVLAIGCGRCIPVCVVRGVAALAFGCERFTPASNSVGTVSDLAELSEGIERCEIQVKAVSMDRPNVLSFGCIRLWVQAFHTRFKHCWRGSDLAELRLLREPFMVRVPFIVKLSFALNTNIIFHACRNPLRKSFQHDFSARNVPTFRYQNVI